MAHGDGEHEKVEAGDGDEEHDNLADFGHMVIPFVIFALFPYEVLEETIRDDGSQSAKYEAKDQIDLPRLHFQLPSLQMRNSLPPAAKLHLDRGVKEHEQDVHRVYRIKQILAVARPRLLAIRRVSRLGHA